MNEEVFMKESRFTEEQFEFALRQVDSGTAVEEIIRKMGVSKAMFDRWHNVFAGLGMAELHRLKQFEQEITNSSTGLLTRVWS